jgi:hypothetical protein
MLKDYFNRWSALVFIAALAILCLAAVFISSLLRTKSPQNDIPTASFVVIPAPSTTPTPDPAISATASAEIEVRDGISKGSVVQIHGTDGAGLRLRSGPGTDYGLKFIGMDTELFEVDDGPVDSDGYVWWYLVSPYDENRSGWAASAYLSLVTGE